eukprot:scaffold1429_cov110-Cylindrotheca_fusiformis.AAC.3
MGINECSISRAVVMSWSIVVQRCSTTLLISMSSQKIREKKKPHQQLDCYIAREAERNEQNRKKKYSLKAEQRVLGIRDPALCAVRCVKCMCFLASINDPDEQEDKLLYINMRLIPFAFRSRVVSTQSRNL